MNLNDSRQSDTLSLVKDSQPRVTRRKFLDESLRATGGTALGVAGTAAASSAIVALTSGAVDRSGSSGLFADEVPTPAATPAKTLGQAEHCIFLWLGGGMAQIDTFDPKRRGDSRANPRRAGSDYDSIETAVSEVRLCEHLRRTAALVDRLTIVRSVHHSVVDEHAFATNLVHTGRRTSGNVVYPSLGSVIAQQRGAVAPKVPAYVLIGYPNVSRGPGFLGAKHGYVYLTDTTAGPAGFSRAADVDARRQSDRERLLGALQERGGEQRGGEQRLLEEYLTAQRESLRLAGPEFLRHFRLEEEPATLRAAYGGEFGQRCLLARRLVQAGVRFIEVSHNLNFINGTGWDTHNQGQQKQHRLIAELDAALAGLIVDLERQQLLDRTLVVVATEFGRPAGFDGGGGRGHQGSAFSMVLAGGGLKHRGVWGATDEMSKEIVSDPVSIPDFHATIQATLQIDPTTELRDGARPVPITDGGQPIRALFG
ncbi:MAG: DUF1501 domain-containing protein [Planctomycetota bacterium]